MRGERRTSPGDLVGDGDDGLGRYARLLLSPLRRVLPVHLLEQLHEVAERLTLGDNLDRAVLFQEVEIGPVLQEVLPVDPPPHEVAVEQVVLDQVVGHGKEHGRLGAGIRREPEVGLRCRVGQPRVDDRDLRAAQLCIDDALGVRVEVVPRFEV